ncbi:unnamed protein product, partial [Scytosiphon promiscuus]
LESGRTTDAVKTMKLCRALGLTIGIATFQREVDDSAHIGGTRLVRRVLGAIGAGDLVSDRDVIALTPGQYAEMIRHQESYTKNDMVRELFERRGEAYSPGTTLLIDDTRRNVEAFVRIGGHGLLVEGGQGLILQNAKVVEPSCTFVPGMTFSSASHYPA